MYFIFLWVRGENKFLYYVFCINKFLDFDNGIIIFKYKYIILVEMIYYCGDCEKFNIYIFGDYV